MSLKIEYFEKNLDNDYLEKIAKKVDLDTLVPELINKAKAGFTVPAEDTKAIVRAIYKLKKMPLIKRKQLGKNGQDYAIKNFDYVKIAKNLEKVLI